MNPGFLFALGATHRTAPFDFRERLALTAEAEACLARSLGGIAGLREFAILGTCNRTEIYGVAERAASASAAAAAFCGRRGVGAAELLRFGFRLEGEAALRHLLEVAAGLDSQMLGENEIFGQVKRAYAAAQARNTAGPVLNRLFQKTFQAAKRARTETAVAAGQVSVASVAVDLAHTVFGRIGDLKILLVGAGEIGEKCARAFQSRGAPRLWVCSRTAERSRALAAELGAEAVPFGEREARLAACDAAVCCTSAPGTVLSAEAVRAAAAPRPSRPLVLIDLAMPRDIDAAASSLQNVFLYNLDDLAGIAEENRLARLAEAGRCRAFLAERTASLWPQIAFQLSGAREPAPAPIAAGGTLLGVA